MIEQSAFTADDDKGIPTVVWARAGFYDSATFLIVTIDGVTWAFSNPPEMLRDALKNFPEGWMKMSPVQETP